MSSQKTGYSLWKNNKLVDYGVWQLLKEDNKDWRARILFMSDNIDNFITTHKIDKIVVEDCPPTLQNAMTIKVLAALQGALLSICHIHNIELEFISVKTWKNKIGINLTGSKEYNSAKKLYKGAKLTKFKNMCKAYEKKLSVDNANYYCNINLVWKSITSKKNEDDISDSICIYLSTIGNYKYKQESFDNIIKHIKQSI